MTIQINIDFNKIVSDIENKAVTQINNGLEELKEYAEEISPTDTQQFIKNHKIEKATINGDIIKGSLVNKTKYAVYLEYGVLGRVYNYYKGKRGGNRKFIFSGVGNRTYTRTAEDMSQRIKKLLSNKLV